MKDFRTMKRQRGRSRSKSGGSNTHNPNRAYESNGPEGVKCRGNAQTIYEKYQQLARDANSSGDRVLAEGFLQHAEHYFRLIRLMQPQRPVSEFVQRDPFSSGFDDFEEDFSSDNNETQEGDDAQEGYAPEGRGADNRGNDRDNRQDRYNNNNRNRDRDRDRDYQPRENREPREPRDNREYRDRDQNRDNRDATAHESQDGSNQGHNRDRNDGNRRETRRERFERRRQQQQRVLDGEATVASFEPQAEVSAAPAFIASTQPLAPAKPVEQPMTTDANALPDFIRRPTPIEPSPVEAAPVAETREAQDAPEAAAKPARKPRAKKVVTENTEA